MAQSLFEAVKVYLCPDCNFKTTKGSQDDHPLLGECTKCSYMFCTNCLGDFHGDSECASEQIKDVDDELAEDLSWLDLWEDEPLISTTFECKICLDDKGLDEAAELGCEHLHCRPCVKSYYEAMINEGSVHNFKCPSTQEDGCPIEISPNIIKELVNPYVFAKYDGHLLDEYLQNVPEIVTCPKLNCDKRFPAMPEFGFCEACDYRFCTTCLKEYHGLTLCNQTDKERRAIILEHIKADEDEKLRLEQEETAARKRQDAESEGFIKELAKKCPHCRVDIEKLDGCNLMSCRCGRKFCWLCLTIIHSKTPYDHFNGQCNLFPGQ